MKNEKQFYDGVHIWGKYGIRDVRMLCNCRKHVFSPFHFSSRLELKCFNEISLVFEKGGCVILGWSRCTLSNSHVFGNSFNLEECSCYWLDTTWTHRGHPEHPYIFKLHCIAAGFYFNNKSCLSLCYVIDWTTLGHMGVI